MKSKFLSILVAMAMVVAGVALSSCGDDNDDPVQPTVNKTATLQPVVYLAEDMLRFYDIVVTVDGKAEVLTQDNTQSTSTSLVGVKYRKYQANAKEYKTFPVTSKAVVSCVKKSSVELSAMEDTQYGIYMTANYGNTDMTKMEEIVEFSTVIELDGLLYSQIPEDELSNYIDRTITGTFTLKDATSCSASFTDSFANK